MWIQTKLGKRSVEYISYIIYLFILFATKKIQRNYIIRHMLMSKCSPKTNGILDYCFVKHYSSMSEFVFHMSRVWVAFCSFKFCNFATLYTAWRIYVRIMEIYVFLFLIRFYKGWVINPTVNPLFKVLQGLI